MTGAQHTPQDHGVRVRMCICACARACVRLGTEMAGSLVCATSVRACQDRALQQGGQGRPYSLCLQLIWAPSMRCSCFWYACVSRLGMAD